MQSPQSTPPLIELMGATLLSGGSLETSGVQGVEWRIRTGDYWVVGGHSDSGKSVLLATAAGLLKPFSGENRLFGENPSTLSGNALLRVRLRIGFVPEGGSRLLQHLTIRDNIALPLRYHQNLSETAPAPMVTALLESMELMRVAHCTPGQVNRSMRQRANLGRALVMAPEVLFLDNPVSGLPPVDVRWWLDFLDQLAQGHAGLGLSPITLIVTTDDLRPWLGRGRQFALLKAGRWVLLGDRETLNHERRPDFSEFLDPDRL